MVGSQLMVEAASCWWFVGELTTSFNVNVELVQRVGVHSYDVQKLLFDGLLISKVMLTWAWGLNWFGVSVVSFKMSWVFFGMRSTGCVDGVFFTHGSIHISVQLGICEFFMSLLVFGCVMLHMLNEKRPLLLPSTCSVETSAFCGRCTKANTVKRRTFGRCLDWVVSVCHSGTMWYWYPGEVRIWKAPDAWDRWESLTRC